MRSRLEGLALLWLPVPLMLLPLLVASAWAGGLEPPCGNPRLYGLITWCHESIAPGILELGGLELMVGAGIAIVGMRRLLAWRR